MTNHLLKSLLLTALLCAPVFCAAADTAKAADQNIQVTSQGPRQGLETTVTLDADDAFLPKILSILGEISGYNIVAGPEVNNRQRISIHIRETPIEQAVNLVVRAAGLSYEIVGNSFLVTNSENLEKEVGISSTLIELQFAKAGEVKDLLKDLTKNIQVDTGKNSLVISSSPKALSEIRRIIDQIDVPSRQIMLQTRIIEVSLSRVKDLGIDWARLSQFTTILVENPSDPLRSGINMGEGSLGQMTRGQLPANQLYEKLDGLKNVGGFSRQLQAFDITVDFLLKNNSARLLTDTKLTTMNNRKATMHVGEIVPFTVQSQMTAQVERESIGVKLEMTPQINKTDFITLSIKPEVSSIKALIDDRIPNKKIRTAETVVQVKDRQRIVIAGLTSDEERMEVHKVPFLGDLLFVGRFFQHISSTNDKMDLIIEITPYILNNAEDLAALMPDSLTDIRDSLEKKRAAYQKEKEVNAPTHLALMPTCFVLKPYQYTIGVHEIAVGQFNRLQVFFSPWQNIGQQTLGIKYQLAPTLALGVGYHWGQSWGTETHFPQRRLGANLVKGLLTSQVLNWYGMAAMDMRFNPGFGEDPRISLGSGLSIHLGPYFALMSEALHSFIMYTDDRGTNMESWGAAGVRLRLPWMKGLSLDGGVSMLTDDRADHELFDAERWKDQEWYQRVYFDAAYSGIF